jgi:predicted phosphodiesterase
MIATVFGDVHGNLIALEKLFFLEKDKTDLFISHGDIVNYGPWSNECLAFLLNQKNCLMLKGNHEEYFISGKYPGQNIVAKSFFDYCYPAFNSNFVSAISNFDFSVALENRLIQHTIDDLYIFKDTDLSDVAVNSSYIIGHSHQQYCIKKNDFEIFNTGSLGQNREYLNQSCYLQVDTLKETIELKYFIHDVNKVIAEMKSRRYPEICLDYYRNKKQL